MDKNYYTALAELIDYLDYGVMKTRPMGPTAYFALQPTRSANAMGAKLAFARAVGLRNALHLLEAVKT